MGPHRWELPVPATACGDEERQMSGRQHPTGHRIVAGVDGSPSSISALRWAVRQARLTGAAVEAAIAWSCPAAAGGSGWTPTGMEAGLGLEVNAEKVLADAISAAYDLGGNVVVRARVVKGIPRASAA
jgi:nucleotide-binding universal stress UspA family protein